MGKHSPSTILTCRTWTNAWNKHPIPNLEILHPRSHGVYHTNALVTENSAWFTSWYVAFNYMRISATDCGIGWLYDRVSREFEDWFGAWFEGDGSVGLVDECFHCWFFWFYFYFSCCLCHDGFCGCGFVRVQEGVWCWMAWRVEIVWIWDCAEGFESFHCDFVVLFVWVLDVYIKFKDININMKYCTYERKFWWEWRKIYIPYVLFCRRQDIHLTVEWLKCHVWHVGVWYRRHCKEVVVVVAMGGVWWGLSDLRRDIDSRWGCVSAYEKVFIHPT